MIPFDNYKRAEMLPHTADACPELETFVLLDASKRYPGDTKGILAARALGVFGRDITQLPLMLAFIDSLVVTKLLYRHDFGFHLTPSGVKHLEQLKSNLRGPLMRALS